MGQSHLWGHIAGLGEDDRVIVFVVGHGVLDETYDYYLSGQRPDGREVAQS